MPNQCATSVLTRTVTVADGIYAPGHLGELTRQFPFELVDDILVQTRTLQTRVRRLPSRVGVYFVLALALFPGLGYARVWDKLTAGLRQLCVRRPSEKSLRDLRRRLGAAPLEQLFTVLAGPAAGPGPRACATGAGGPSPSTDAAPPRPPTGRGYAPGSASTSTATARRATRC